MTCMRERVRGIESARVMRWAVVVCCCLSVVVAGLLAGCGGSGGSEPSSSPTSTADIVRGGVLRIASQDATVLDPATMASAPDYLLATQVYEWLVVLDKNLEPQPSLAVSWKSSTDGKTWTFKLRQGVVFHDGTPFTSADVVSTFARLMDPDVGSAASATWAVVKSIEAVDDYTVAFHLKHPASEFPVSFGDIHSPIMPTELTNPTEKAVGTGPFMLESFSSGDRAVLKANKQYWRKGADGQPLPYLDGLTIIYSPDVGGQVEALRAGDVDWVGGLPAQLAQTLSSDPGFQVLTNISNMHYSLHMRTDRGPTKDERVRLALRLGTDQAAMAKLVRPGLSSVGNGTAIGPLFKKYYIDEKPPYDPERAKQLLAEAGYPDGLSIKLVTQNNLDIPAMATVWQAQMAKIGVKVQIQLVPIDVYFGSGKHGWLTADFAITDWMTRPPLGTLQVSYPSYAPWNGSHWADAEYDDLMGQIESEMDEQKRIELYHRAQEILLERGPVVMMFFANAACGVTANVHGITLAPEWCQTPLTEAYLSQ